MNNEIYEAITEMCFTFTPKNVQFDTGDLFFNKYCFHTNALNIFFFVPKTTAHQNYHTHSLLKRTFFDHHTIQIVYRLEKESQYFKFALVSFIKLKMPNSFKIFMRSSN